MIVNRIQSLTKIIPKLEAGFLPRLILPRLKAGSFPARPTKLVGKVRKPDQIGVVDYISRVTQNQ